MCFLENDNYKCQDTDFYNFRTSSLLTMLLNLTFFINYLLDKEKWNLFQIKIILKDNEFLWKHKDCKETATNIS